MTGDGAPATVRLFAAAAEAVGSEQVELNATTVGQVVAELAAIGGPEAARVLSLCAVLVAGVRADGPAAAVPPGALVDVLPPFAGG
jgi:molybdopterin converting factor small subunit